MSAPRFKISDRIKVKDEYDEYFEGHVVIIMNPFLDEREYYCSMYPGALSNYCYVDCVDLSMDLLNDGKINTLQALNKYSENQLEYSDTKRTRKEKLKNINKI
jgi:hypothetical protein